MSSGCGEREGPNQDILWVIRLPLHNIRGGTRQTDEVLLLNLLLFPAPVCSSVPRPGVFLAVLPLSARGS